MAQCQGTTRKGERCKRQAQEGAAFCSIHVDQAVRARSAPTETEWNQDALLKAAFGFLLVGAILFLKIRR